MTKSDTYLLNLFINGQILTGVDLGLRRAVKSLMNEYLNLQGKTIESKHKLALDSLEKMYIDKMDSQNTLIHELIVTVKLLKEENVKLQNRKIND